MKRLMVARRWMIEGTAQRLSWLGRLPIERQADLPASIFDATR
jgi:hypothetical protein